MLILPSLLCALAPALCTQNSSGSLEGFLARARAKQAAQQQQLLPRLAPLLEELSAKPGRDSDHALVRQRVIELGPEVAPLLVKELEASIELGTQSLQRALEVTIVLSELKPAGINRELIAMASGGSTIGKRNAVKVLGHVSSPLGVNAFLTEIYRKGDPELRAAAIASIAERGEQKSLGLLREALADKDPEIRRRVLAALGKARDEEAASSVLAALAVPAAAAHMSSEVIEYYLAVPDAVDDIVIVALGHLAVASSDASDACLAILGALPDFPAARRTRELRQILEPLKQATLPNVREATLICLYLNGDRQTKKSLLQVYDENVKNDPRFYQAFTERGEVQLKMREYSDAIRDFKQGLELINNDRSPAYENTMINLARAQALSGKLARAHSTLEELELSQAHRQRLGQEPSFKALLENQRYGKIFQ